MKSFRQKQLRTTILLSAGIAACILAGIHFRGVNSSGQTQTPTAIYQREIDSALQRYRGHTDAQAAELVTGTAEDYSLKTELLFYGSCGEDTFAQILDALGGSAVQARFFLTAVEAGAHSKLAAQAAEAGYEVGVFNDGSSSVLTGVSPETVVSNLSRTSTAIQSAYGMQPSSLLTLEEPEGELLYAAFAAYFDEVYVAGETAELSSIGSRADAEALVGGLSRHGLLAVHLSSGLSSADGLEHILNALDDTDLNARADALLAKPLSESAEAVRSIRTIERSVAFDLSGLGSEAELAGVLDALRNNGATATFFFTADELRANTERIEGILAQGHALGISIDTADREDPRELLGDILLARELLTDLYSYDKDAPVRAKNGNPSEALCTAAAAGGFTAVSADIVPTKTGDARSTDAAEVLSSVMPESWGALRRGEIAHFYLGLYQSDAMLGELITQMVRNRCVYAVRPVMDILGNTEQLYSYPVAKEDMLPEVRDAIHPGQLKGDAFAEIRRRYIGIRWVNTTYYLPGFTQQEINKLDTTGLINNNRDMVFLSFDDWGTDANLTKLLDVLRLHDVKATFFVRTNFVESNPNLLRAIAAEGHAIGCHTDAHLPLSIVSEDGNTYAELSETQAEELRDDLVLSYQKLQSIIGDIEVDGVPALSRLFRPPTLAVGKLGLTTVLDCGFTYSVSGSFTSEDYKAESADALASDLKRNTKSGAVIVMHMSDNSVYTAEALDIYLTELEQGTERYRFARLTDALEG